MPKIEDKIKTESEKEAVKDSVKATIKESAKDSSKTQEKAPEKDNAQLEADADFLFKKEFIKIQSIGHLRGRSIPFTMFIVDETQNIQPKILLDIVTRAAKGTKIVLLGDPTQVNKPGLNTRRNGLVYISEKMKGHSLCWQVTLNSEKSIRSDLAQEALKILI